MNDFSNITVRCPSDLIERLERMNKAMKLNNSEATRRALEHMIGHWEQTGMLVDTAAPSVAIPDERIDEAVRRYFSRVLQP